MYHIKVMKLEPGRGVVPESASGRMLECVHYLSKTVYPGSAAAQQGLDEPGVTLTLTDKDNQVTLVRLPADGDVAYVIAGESGKTVDTLHWPPRPSQRLVDAKIEDPRGEGR